MSTNLYGPGDNYHPQNSHVIPALLRWFHEAKMASRPSVEIGGSGMPLRGFLYVDDLAAGCVHVMNVEKETYERHTQPMQGHINIGSGSELSIRDLAAAVSTTVGYRGDVVFDPSKPDGTPRKLMDSSRCGTLGWRR
jgi:GDP-L-fucose synthase